jgi:hypothetical protein
MGRALGLPFVAALLQAAQPAAGACLPPDGIVERMDEYFSKPRGAATYRALAGLGDPRIEPITYYESPYPKGEEETALMQRMLPVDNTEMGGSHYSWIETGECRPAYAVQTARARIARLGPEHPYVRHWFAAQRAAFSACAGRDPPLQALPAPLPVSEPSVARLQRDDRAYQAASQLFYRKSAAAPAAFRRIAASSSEHAPMARYMMLAIKAEWPPLKLAPAPVRETQAERRVPPMNRIGPPDRLPVPVPEVLAEARSILADRRLASIHALTQGLVGSLGYESDYDGGAYPDRGLAAHAPEIRREQVRLTLEALRTPTDRLRADPVARERYARALADIDKLHGDFPDSMWGLTGALPEKAFASRAMAEAAKSDRLAAWTILPKSPFEQRSWSRVGRERHDYTAWHDFVSQAREGADSRAWEVAEASLTSGYEMRRWPDSEMARALRCADEASLAALPTLFYHRVRDGLMSGRLTADPSRTFEEVLSHLQSWPWQESAHYRAAVAASLRYLIGAGRIAEARTLRDRLVLKDEYGSHYDLPLLLLAEDENRFVRQMKADASSERPVLFNLLSTAALTRLAERGDLPAEERGRFARVAWTRLYAMGRPVPAGLDRLMRRLNPEITAGWTSRPGRGRSGDRLLLDVLRSPGLNILMTTHQREPQSSDRSEFLTRIDTHQHSDNNWWCAWQTSRHSGALDVLLYQQFFGKPDGYFRRDREDPLEIAGARTVLEPLLGGSYWWSARGPAEEERLAKIDCAPKIMAERAIAWKGKHTSGQDEALALAVRATRYGCQRQGGHGAYSKAAFTLLHKRFPESAAAKRTRYWFDCAHFSGGCPPAEESLGR